MKTKALIILFSFFICFSLYAQNEDSIKVYSNINKSENGTSKEYIVYNNVNPQILTKVIYAFDLEGKRTERVLYLSDNKNKWIPIQMHSYKYNEEGRITDIIYTIWNKNKKCWNEKSDYLTHIYDNDGKLLAVNKKTFRTASNLAQK